MQLWEWLAVPLQGKVRKTTYNKVTTRYWAKVASVAPRDWTAKATRIAQAIEALAYELITKPGALL